jgi:hypothetical protein
MSEEKTIHYCHTGLVVGDKFFCNEQHVRTEYLLPAIHELALQCDEIIKEPGAYKIELRIIKIK